MVRETNDSIAEEHIAYMLRGVALGSSSGFAPDDAHRVELEVQEVASEDQLAARLESLVFRMLGTSDGGNVSRSSIAVPPQGLGQK